MREYITRAIVLDIRAQRDFDKEVIFFSQEFGKFRAVLVGGRRITSKFAQHCNVLHEVIVRVVYKNRYTVTDILEEKKLLDVAQGPIARQAFLLAYTIAKIAPEEVSDKALWTMLLHDSSSGVFDVKKYLSHFGYDVTHASCARCGKMPIWAFLLDLQIFLCRSCSLKAQESELLLI